MGAEVLSGKATHGVGKGLRGQGHPRDLLESSRLRNRALGVWVPPFGCFPSWGDSNTPRDESARNGPGMPRPPVSRPPRTPQTGPGPGEREPPVHSQPQSAALSAFVCVLGEGKWCLLRASHLSGLQPGPAPAWGPRLRFWGQTAVG